MANGSACVAPPWWSAAAAGVDTDHRLRTTLLILDTRHVWPHVFWQIEVKPTDCYFPGLIIGANDTKRGWKCQKEDKISLLAQITTYPCLLLCGWRAHKTEFHNFFGTQTESQPQAQRIITLWASAMFYFYLMFLKVFSLDQRILIWTFFFFFLSQSLKIHYSMLSALALSILTCFQWNLSTKALI